MRKYLHKAFARASNEHNKVLCAQTNKQRSMRVASERAQNIKLKLNDVGEKGETLLHLMLLRCRKNINNYDDEDLLFALLRKIRSLRM